MWTCEICGAIYTDDSPLHQQWHTRLDALTEALGTVIPALIDLTTPPAEPDPEEAL